MPALRRYSLNKAREALISTLEEKRKIRVIILIHRQEGIPAASILKVLEKKDIKDIEDQRLF